MGIGWLAFYLLPSQFICALLVPTSNNREIY